jgi:hypothetical protein
MGHSPRQKMLVGFAAGVTEAGVRQSIERAIESFSEVSGRIPLEHNNEIKSEASVSRVVICGEPYHLGRLHQDGVALVHIEDLVDMLHEAQERERDGPRLGHWSGSTFMKY